MNADTDHSKTRTQLFPLLALLLTAFILRAWQPLNMDVEHFDEGVYAANFFSSHLGFRYPDQQLYAPPLFPAILEWAVLLSGGNLYAVMWVNVVLGTALVAAVWWLVRLVQGETEALAAATFICFSDLLIQYSRAALTDIPVVLLITLAVCSGILALRDQNNLALVATSALTASAWWTKYNGWLPLAILGAGLTGWVVFDRPSRKAVLPRVGQFLAISAGAVLFWLPCLWGLQAHGGYSAVAKNHAGYVVGFSGWWESAVRQFSLQQRYSDLTTVGIAIVIITLIASISNASLLKRLMAAAVGLGICLVVAVTIPWGSPLILLGVLSLCGFYAGYRSQTAPSQHPEARLGWWMMLAWFCGLLLATPMYRPYPRLGLPFMVVCFSAAGIGVVWSVRVILGRCDTVQLQRLPYGLCALVVLVPLSFQGWILSEYQDRSEFRRIASEIVEATQDDHSGVAEIDAIFYVLGEPGIYVQLANQSNSRFNFVAQPASNLGMLPPKPNAPRVPTYLILGPHALQEQAELPARTDQVELMKVWDYEASDLVLLDDLPPSQLEANREQKIQLWKVIRN